MHRPSPTSSLLMIAMRSCLRVNNCLLLYERASGQKVNFKKSSTFFNANVPVDIRTKIRALLAVSQETHVGRYLAWFKVVVSIVDSNGPET